MAGGKQAFRTVVLECRLAESVLTLSKAAAAVEMSKRSLQRRLVAEGTNFSMLLDDARRKKLEITLANNCVLPPDMHGRLGYAHISILRRAFRRWDQSTSMVRAVGWRFEVNSIQQIQKCKRAAH